MEQKNDKNREYKVTLYSKQMFFFFLIVSGNYISEIFSCNIQKQFTENRLVKHILGIMTMYFFVTFVDEDKYQKPIFSFLTAICLYIWFIIISITANNYTIIIISILFLIYVSNNVFNYYIRTSENQSKIEKISENKKYLQIFLFVISIMITLYGFFIYLGQKKIEYGKKFSYQTFFLGTVKCKYNGIGKQKKIDNLSYIYKSFN